MCLCFRVKRELLKHPLLQKLQQHLCLSSGGGVASKHPKLKKLQEVLLEHFERHSRAESSTRSIVFTQYRHSVEEIVELLEGLKPLIKVGYSSHRTHYIKTYIL